MRKYERRHDAQWAMDVFRRAPYVTLSMTRQDGAPYGLPLSMVCTDDYTFYFHCADEGEKLDCILANPIIALSAVSKCSPKFEEEKENYTMYYHSAVAVGHAEIVCDDDEKIMALRLLCERFLPKYMEHFNDAIRRSLSRTTVVRIRLVEPAVGKSKPADL